MTFLEAMGKPRKRIKGKCGNAEIINFLWIFDALGSSKASWDHPWVATGALIVVCYARVDRGANFKKEGIAGIPFFQIAKTAPRDPPDGQEGPKTAPESPKMAQVGLHMASRWPPRGLHKAQDDFQDGSRAPKRLQDGQERSKTAQDGLKTAQEAPKKPQESSKRTP